MGLSLELSFFLKTALLQNSLVLGHLQRGKSAQMLGIESNLKQKLQKGYPFPKIHKAPSVRQSHHKAIVFPGHHLQL